MAAEGQDTNQEKSQGLSSSTGGSSFSSTLTMVLTLVNTLVSVGMLVILFISFQHQKQQPSVSDISIHSGTESEGGEHGKAEEGKKGESEKAHPDKAIPNAGKIVTLEQFTVNLSTPGATNPKFVRVNISLEVQNDETEAEVNSKVPQVRNAIIDLFNSKRPADLATVEGRDYLKQEIKAALDGFLLSGKIKGVFFTSFALAG